MVTPKVPPEERKPLGRPSSYTTAIGEAICARIAEGEALTAICHLPGMPTYQTMCHWRRTIPGFLEAVKAAREDQGETMAQRIIGITEVEPAYDELGKVDAGMVAHRRMQMDGYKWLAARLRPKEYGDKVQQEHSGPDGGPIIVSTGVPAPK